MLCRYVLMSIAIVIDMRPLDTVNGQGFMELIKVLEPRYNMESRSHITNTVLPKMYAELRDTVKRKLGEAKFLSLTTDGWTGRNSKSFNTVTAQYISREWEYHNYVLSTKEMKVSHTADN